MILCCFENAPSWVTWVFSGVGVSILGGGCYLIKTLFFSKEQKGESKDSKNSMKQDVRVEVNVNTNKPQGESMKDSPTTKGEFSLDELKLKTNILFIDDESFKIVTILKKTEGWINTKSIKDISSLSAPEIKWAHIIFVDVNGVGSKLFNNQGLGVAKELKNRYPEKRVIIYSAEMKHDAFSDAWDVVDAKLPKNADPIMFITKVESFAQSIFNNE